MFVRANLIDYVHIVIAPIIIGGKDVSTLVDGKTIYTGKRRYKTGEKYFLTKIKYTNITAAAIIFFQLCLKTVEKVKKPLQKQMYKIIIIDSAINVPKTAPIPLNLGIKSTLKTKLVTAPIITYFALFLICPEGVKYKSLRHVLIPVISKTGTAYQDRNTEPALTGSTASFSHIAIIPLRVLLFP